MTIKLTNTDPIPFRAQGVAAECDPASIHPDAFDIIFTYGLRRFFQDHINSLAKAKRDDGETVTEAWVSEVIAARMDAVKTGEISVRGESADPLDAWRMKAVRAVMKTPAGSAIKAGYDAIPSDNQSDRRAFLLHVAANNAEAIDARAKRLRDVAEAEAAEAAAIAGELKM